MSIVTFIAAYKDMNEAEKKKITKIWTKSAEQNKHKRIVTVGTD